MGCSKQEICPRPGKGEVYLGTNPDFRTLFLIRSFSLEREEVKVISSCGIIKRPLKQDLLAPNRKQTSVYCQQQPLSS